MAAKSKHMLDIYNWIFDVINSCKTQRQLTSTKNLIRIFTNKYSSKLDLNYFHKLRIALDIKYGELPY